MSTFIRTGEPINGRQNYVVYDKENHKKYTYSIPVENCDRFEKHNAELDGIVQSFDNLNADKMAEDFAKTHATQKTKIAVALGGLVGGGIPLGLSLKYIKGKKKYFIAGASAIVCGAISACVAGLAMFQHLLAKTTLKTEQMQELKKFALNSPNFDLKLEKKEKI